MDHMIFWIMITTVFANTSNGHLFPNYLVEHKKSKILSAKLFLSKEGKRKKQEIICSCYKMHLRDAPNKKNGIFWEFFPKGGGGSSQFPKLLQINQVILGMPKSFLGAKTCFTIVGR